MNVALIIVLAIIFGAVGGAFLMAILMGSNGSKYDGTIGLEQQDDGHWAVAIHYDIDKLDASKQSTVVLKVEPDRKNPIVNNGNLEENSTKEES